MNENGIFDGIQFDYFAPNGSELVEGTLYFYITSNWTGDWVLGKSDGVELRAPPRLRLVLTFHIISPDLMRQASPYHPAACGRVVPALRQGGKALGLIGFNVLLMRYMTISGC